MKMCQTIDNIEPCYKMKNIALWASGDIKNKATKLTA